MSRFSASWRRASTLAWSLSYPAAEKPWSAMFNRRLRPMTPKPIMPISYFCACIFHPPMHSNPWPIQRLMPPQARFDQLNLAPQLIGSDHRCHRIRACFQWNRNTVEVRYHPRRIVPCRTGRRHGRTVNVAALHAREPGERISSPAVPGHRPLTPSAIQLDAHRFGSRSSR